jgi:hypothetical protein
MEQLKFEISIEEFYQVVGELEIVRRKQLIQINEMAAEITRLREENGRLVQANNNE